MARGARSATSCEAVTVKWANASNRRGPSARLYFPGAGHPDHAGRALPGVAVQPPLAGSARRSSRGAAAVCIPVFGADHLFAQCLRSVLKHTPPEVASLVADDASLDPACARLVEEVNAADPERPPVAYHRQPENVGFVHNVNHALRMLAPADVIVLNSDCVVAKGWYEGMRGNAMCGHARGDGVLAHQPRHDLEGAGAQPAAPSLPQNWSLDDAAAAVRASSPGLHPALPAAIGHCVYIRRRALDLVGAFDEAFAPGYEEEVDFSQRCARQGLSHVLADDVLVLHHGSGSFSAAAAELKEEHHRLIQSRYPYWDGWVAEVEEAQDTPLARSLSAARRVLRGPTITIDGRILTEFMTGTQLHALEVIAGVHDARPAEIRVIVPAVLADYAADLLGGLERVRLVTEDEARASPRRTWPTGPGSCRRSKTCSCSWRWGSGW